MFASVRVCHQINDFDEIRDFKDLVHKVETGFVPTFEHEVFG